MAKTKKLTPKRTYTVYSIMYKKQPIYIGRTYDIKKRQKEHNRDFLNNKKKLLYDFLHQENYTSTIELIPLYEFYSLSDSINMECLLILEDYFKDKLLKQKVPNIRF